jgi:hypothetical protein
VLPPLVDWLGVTYREEGHAASTHLCCEVCVTPLNVKVGTKLWRGVKCVVVRGQQGVFTGQHRVARGMKTKQLTVNVQQKCQMLPTDQGRLAQ